MRDRTTGECDADESLADQFAKILPTVMDMWMQRVAVEVPMTAKLEHSVLVGSLPLLLVDLQDVISPANTEAGAADTTLGTAHGRERALMTEYRPCDLMHELQILRDVLIDAIEEESVAVTSGQLATIRRHIDEVSRESLTGFNAVREMAHHMFNSAMSSDVRNLLNVVGVTAQIIEKKARDPSTVSLAKRIIGKTSEVDAVLQSIVSDASLTRNLKLKLTITPVMLLPLIENVRVEFQTQQRRITIRSDPIQGYWSWSAMERALRNLLIHAQQFGSTSDDITISASVAYERLLLSVHTKNYALGIDDMAALFERNYVQYGVPVNEGQGLVYVQEVAESHGGSLIIRSSPSTGTSFTINIPLDARAYVEH